MKRIVWKFGFFAGAIIAVMTAINVPACMNGHVDFTKGAIIGYSTMVLSFLLVYFAIRSYRDNVSGGTISFGQAFKVGILTCLVACAVYVVAWEITFWGFIPDFADKYAAASLAAMQRAGKSAAEIAEATADMEKFKVWYRNPLYNIGMTFMEIFPPGLIVTLISAAILRKPGTRVPRVATA
jgi:zinc transporter ZupT